ncbi:HAD-IA family hydrolase [Aurantivibrio plasticivorans]
MNLKAVVFDLDGTLIDTAPDFVTTVNTLLAEEDAPLLSEEAIRRVVSNGARALVRRAFDIDLEHPDFDRLLQRLLTIYSERLCVDTTPFPGIDQVLKCIDQNNLAWGIVTNKPSQYTNPIVEQLAFNPQPGSVVCPDHVSRSKPDPEPLILACQHLGCHPQDVLYVGDHLRDIECGKRAGSATVAAAYGYIDEGDDPQSWQADHTIHAAAELVTIIESQL